MATKALNRIIRHGRIALRLFLQQSVTRLVGIEQRFPVNAVPECAIGKPWVVRPATRFQAGIDDKAVVFIDVIQQPRVARRNRRYATRHVFHQRQALTLAPGSIHRVCRGGGQLVVLLISEVARYGDHAAAERRKLIQVIQQHIDHLRRIVAGQLQNQGRIGIVAECTAEGPEYVIPVLAAVPGVENSGVDSPAELDADWLADWRGNRRRGTVLWGVAAKGSKDLGAGGDGRAGVRELVDAEAPGWG